MAPARSWTVEFRDVAYGFRLAARFADRAAEAGERTASPFRLTGLLRSSAARIAGSCSPRSMPPPCAQASLPAWASPMPAPFARISSPRPPRRRKMPHACSRLPAGPAATAPLSMSTAMMGCGSTCHGVPHLFGGARALLADMARRFAKLGFTARIALAETLGGAHALARYARSSSIIVPQGEIGEALAPLPVEALRLEQRDHAAAQAARPEAHRPALRSAARLARAAVPLTRSGRSRASSPRSGAWAARGAAQPAPSRARLRGEASLPRAAHHP